MIGRIESWGQELRTMNQEKRAEELVDAVDDEEQWAIDRSQDGTQWPVLWGADQSALDWVRTGKGTRPW
jgi:hypothetical protein